jgi:capsular polysaccharide biosynthesis protein
LPSEGPKKIYISRRDVGRRLPKNETEVEALLVENGFDIVRLADLAFKEQIRICQNAELIVGAHGAGLAHTVWARPGQARVVEIRRPENVLSFEWLARVGHLDYSKVESDQQGDWMVDLEVLREAISES